MNPIDLLRQRQAQNRLDHARKQAARSQPRSSEYRYVGYDAEQGKAIVSNGSDNASGNAITNGLIKPNQPVKVTQANRLIQIDAMPRPKPKSETPNPPESYPIKLLSYNIVETDIPDRFRLEFFVTSISMGGKVRFRSQSVYFINYWGSGRDGWVLPVRAKISSTGKGIDDWIIGVKAEFANVTWIANITPRRVWELSIADEPKVQALNFSHYRGHGFWSAPSRVLDRNGFWRGRVLSDRDPGTSFAWHNGQWMETSGDQFFVLPEVAIPASTQLWLDQLFLVEARLRAALYCEATSQISLDPNEWRGEDGTPVNGVNFLWFQATRFTDAPEVLGRWGTQFFYVFDDEFQQPVINPDGSKNIESIQVFDPTHLKGQNAALGLPSSFNYARSKLTFFWGTSTRRPKTNGEQPFTQAYADLNPKGRELRFYRCEWGERGFAPQRHRLNVNLPAPDDHLETVTPLTGQGVPYQQLLTIDASYYPL